jgi:von Willebrand factor type A domain
MIAASVAVLVVLAGGWYGFGKLSKSSCSGTLSLNIGAAPELVSALQAQATEWAAASRVGDRCVSIEVTSADPADLAAAIGAPAKVYLTGVGQSSGNTKVPDVWVPDSTVWLQRLRTGKADLVPAETQSIARSPIVLAMPEPVATAFGGPQAKLTWTDLLTKMTGETKLKVGIVDPTRDVSGLGGLLALSTAAQASGGNAAMAGTAALRVLAAGSSPVREEVLRRFPRGADRAALSDALGAAPLTEQAVIAYNGTQPPVQLATLQVEPALNPLDYPYVTLPGTVGDKATIAAAFYKSLGSDAFRDRLAAAGLRGADSTPGRGFPALAGSPASLPAPAAPEVDGAAAERVLSTWLTITLPGRMLLVLDISGSMLELVPTAGNQTRMVVAAETTRRGLGLLDDKWAVGLWTFSTLLDGDKDYKELVPIAPMSAQRTQLNQTLAAIQAKRDGDTGLYDTVLAGYKAVQRSWSEGAFNSLVVMTDGQNDDKAGIALDQLISELKNTADPAKRVSVILIGIGTAVSEPELEKITNAVGGGTFIATDPAKIGEIFLKAVSLRATQR